MAGRGEARRAGGRQPPAHSRAATPGLAAARSTAAAPAAPPGPPAAHTSLPPATVSTANPRPGGACGLQLRPRRKRCTLQAIAPRSSPDGADHHRAHDCEVHAVLQQGHEGGRRQSVRLLAPMRGRAIFQGWAGAPRAAAAPLGAHAVQSAHPLEEVQDLLGQLQAARLRVSQCARVSGGQGRQAARAGWPGRGRTFSMPCRMICCWFGLRVYTISRRGTGTRGAMAAVLMSCPQALLGLARRACRGLAGRGWHRVVSPGPGGAVAPQPSV